jgi:hypothetical protein
MGRSERALRLAPFALVPGLALAGLFFEREQGLVAPERAAAAVLTDTRPAVIEESRRSFARSFEAFLARVPVAPRLAPGAERVREELERARRARGRVDLVAYRGSLESILRTSKAAAHELARALCQLDLEDPRLAFATALALAPWVDEEATGTLLAGLASQDRPAVRPTLVLALRGASDPRVDASLVDLLEADSDPDVRSAAAFTLADRLDRMDPALAGRARARAWSDLEGGDARAAADVLGAGGLDEKDRERLVKLAGTRAEPARRVAALRILASAGASREELGPLLDSIASEPGASGELEALAATWRRATAAR